VKEEPIRKKISAAWGVLATNLAKRKCTCLELIACMCVKIFGPVFTSKLMRRTTSKVEGEIQVPAPYFRSYWIDRLLGLSGLIYFPIVYQKLIYVSVPTALLALDFAIIAGALLIRRLPENVSAKASHWIFSGLRLASLPAYFFFSSKATVALLPLPWGYYSTAILGILRVATHLNLGRSFGIVPAKRKLIITGAYSFVRHPITSCQVLIYLNLLLFRASIWNACLVAVFVGILVAKSQMEEDYLLQDAEYEEYKKGVRWSFLPGLY
jgi:protein-S-isoprenylcysteine O-methyltransferase Ste14